MFHPSILKAGDGGEAKECSVDATYSNFIVDRDIVDGVCTSPSGCIENVWIGSVTSPVATITIEGPTVVRSGLDILPGVSANSWPCPLKPMPVAVLSTPDFDASKIDPRTVTFGKTDTEALDPTQRQGASRHFGAGDGSVHGLRYVRAQAKFPMIATISQCKGQCGYEY